MKNITALLVDDQEGMRKVMEGSLQRAGFDVEWVVEAINGRDALEAFSQHPADLVICDVNMPVMSGLDFLRELRLLPAGADARVIMVSGRPLGSVVAEALRAGACGFLLKPFSVETLIQCVSAALESFPAGEATNHPGEVVASQYQKRRVSYGRGLGRFPE
jgi:CheY-like chemotaxis protein